LGWGSAGLAGLGVGYDTAHVLASGLGPVAGFGAFVEVRRRVWQHYDAARQEA